MSKVGIWNGVDPGAALIDKKDRVTQNANYSRASQIFNLKAKFTRLSDLDLFLG